MALTTYAGRTQRALAFKTRTDLWAAIGHAAAWENEVSPDAEDPTSTGITTPICFVRPSELSMAIPVNSGQIDVTIQGQGYRFIADEDVDTESARFVYFKAIFDGTTGQPHDSFRQHAIYSNLEPTNGHENDPWLAPAHVSDPGRLQWYANHVVQAGSTQQIEIILEFR